MLLKWIQVLIVVVFGNASSTLLQESHKFHVLGTVKYRCYAGYDGKKVVDELTKEPCDNKTYESTLFDKFVSINIKDDPDPENSTELAGGWLEKFDFKGRTFEVAITLFKEPFPAVYRARLVVEDNETTSRKTAVFCKMKSPKEMNPLSIDYSSAGKKEEISFWVEVRPSL